MGAYQDGRAYGSEGKLRIGPRQGRKPDVWLYLEGRRPNPTEPPAWRLTR